MSSTKQQYFVLLQHHLIIEDMKNTIKLLAIALFAVAFMTTGCRPKDSVLVSTQNLSFGLDAGTQTIEVTANCKWTINYNDDADWYTVTPEGGKKDGTISVTVKAYPDGDFRISTFTVTSPGGHIRRKVFVSQNKLDFDGIKNKIFGVFELEHWVTDFYDQIIEEDYHHWEYDPYDTTQGHLMYFFDDGTGMQRNRALHDYAIYFPFVYEYDEINHNLHIEFELADGNVEIYNAEVLCASDSLYRVFHEYKSHRFERADHRKIGTINPGEKELLRRKVSKREGKGGIYRIK